MISDDQMMLYYGFAHRSIKWWKQVFSTSWIQHLSMHTSCTALAPTTSLLSFSSKEQWQKGCWRDTRLVKFAAETSDPSWSKFGEDPFPTAHDTLFGDAFQLSLTTRVERTLLSLKQYSLRSVARRTRIHLPHPPEGTSNEVVVLLRGPSCQVRRQAWQEQPPVQPIFFPEERGRVQLEQTEPQLPKARPTTTISRAKFPGDQPRKHQPKKP